MKNNGHHCYEGTSIKAKVSFILVWVFMLRSKTKRGLLTLIKTTDYLHERSQKLQMNTDNLTIQKLKQTGSIHLYNCNSKAPPRPIRTFKISGYSI